MSTHMALSTIFLWCVCIVAATDCSNGQGNSDACTASEDVASLIQNGITRISLDGEESAASIASYSVSENDALTAESSVEGVHVWLGQEDDQSQVLTVTFQHQGKEHEYELLPHSIYKEGAQIYSGSELLEMEPTRTYRVRDDGKWASMTLHEDGTVRGLFEDDGRVMEIQPVAHQEPEVAASLLQGYEGDSPAHLIRWVGAPDLPAKASLGQTDDQGKPEDENGHIPEDSSGPGPIEEEPKLGAMKGSWGGTKWWPGCYAGDKDPHEFIIGFAADKAAVDKEGSQSALKSKLDSIVNEASFVYEKQLNIKLKLGQLKMATTDAEFGSCPASREMYNKLDVVKAKVSSGTLASKGAVHLWTGCGARWGVIGLAYVGTICGGSYATGTNKIHGGSSPWLTFAHELGHNFRGKHSFEDGQGRTGGIMDYGDGKLNGHYQFNTKYRKTEICAKVDAVVNKCNGNFQKDSGAPPAGGPAPPPPAGPPATTSTTTQYVPPTGSVTCDFEDMATCNKMWGNAAGDNFDWRRSTKTPSWNTGPSKAASGSYFNYIETSSPRRKGDKAYFKSTMLTLGSGASLKFKYHMYGKTTGELKVMVVPKGSASGNTVWQKAGNIGNAWKSADVSLSNYDGKDVNLMFVGIRGSSWSGDIAIDDITFDKGAAGPAPTTQAPTTQAPTTQAPTTQAPTTQAPTTQAPTTQAPTTQAPATQAPTTQAPPTQGPTTATPATTIQPPGGPPANGDLVKKITQLEGKLDQILQLLRSLTNSTR